MHQITVRVVASLRVSGIEWVSDGQRAGGIPGQVGPRRIEFGGERVFLPEPPEILRRRLTAALERRQIYSYSRFPYSRGLVAGLRQLNF
jgi:hypothetical protein